MAGTISRAFLVLALFLSGAVLAQSDAPQAAEATQEVGEDQALDREGERCISTRAIRETDIVDERTILFRMRGGDIYVNELANDCRALLRERRFSYRPAAGRLCNVDTIRVLEQFGGTLREGRACGLGAFYPISEEEAELLKVEARARRGQPQIGVENPNAEDADEDSDSAESDGQGDATAP